MRIKFYLVLGMMSLFLLAACGGEVKSVDDQAIEAVETQEIGDVDVENEVDAANIDNENDLDDEGSAESTRSRCGGRVANISDYRAIDCKGRCTGQGSCPQGWQEDG